MNWIVRRGGDRQDGSAARVDDEKDAGWCGDHRGDRVEGEFRIERRVVTVDLPLHLQVAGIGGDGDGVRGYAGDIPNGR